MRTYTIVYDNPLGETQIHTLQAADPDEATHTAAAHLVPNVVQILHVIEHHVPKVTVCLDGDHTVNAFSDGAVELLHVYTGNTAAEDAQINGDNLMPSCRQAENLAYKQDDAFGFSLVELDHRPEEARFDHVFVNDEERVREYTEAVQEELAS